MVQVASGIVLLSSKIFIYFNKLEKNSLWSITCVALGMDDSLPIALFKRFAALIADGQPLWAVLWANEYLEPDNPLRQALVEKAVLVMENASTPASRSILNGGRLRELVREKLTLPRERRHLPRKKSFPSPGKIYERRIKEKMNGAVRSASIHA